MQSTRSGCGLQTNGDRTDVHDHNVALSQCVQPPRRREVLHHAVHGPPAPKLEPTKPASLVADHSFGAAVFYASELVIVLILRKSFRHIINLLHYVVPKQELQREVVLGTQGVAHKENTSPAQPIVKSLRIDPSHGTRFRSPCIRQRLARSQQLQASHLVAEPEVVLSSNSSPIRPVIAQCPGVLATAHPSTKAAGYHRQAALLPEAGRRPPCRRADSAVPGPFDVARPCTYMWTRPRCMSTLGWGGSSPVTEWFRALCETLAGYFEAPVDNRYGTQRSNLASNQEECDRTKKRMSSMLNLTIA
eukprot:scaffold6331_cov403-Prasinococcus_capsulatus_cf.AAC.3